VCILPKDLRLEPGDTTLQTKRLGATEEEPHALEVQSFLLAASTLLLHLERTPGVHVVSKRAWALTDEFEAHFTYRGRLWVVETPFSLIWVSLLGRPGDDDLFLEIESRVQSYPWCMSLLAPVALLRYLLVRFTPSRKTFQRYGLRPPGERGARVAQQIVAAVGDA
jgi:hypothetical protein